MENEEDVSKCEGFSGPITVTEIRKLLSIKKPVQMIGRRKSIAVSQPSRSIYKEIPNIGSWANINLFNNSFEYQESFAHNYKSDITTEEKDSLLSEESFNDSVIVISDDDSYENIDLIKDIKTNSSTFIDNFSSDIDNSCVLNNSAVGQSSDQNYNEEDIGNTLNSSQSIDEGKNVSFNDTLEEMEMLIKQIQNKAINSNEKNNVPSVLGCPTPVVNEHSESDEFKKPCSRIPVNKKKVDSKKLPISPYPKNCKTDKFKDVVSPVAIYIKNSPSVPHIQNVPLKPLQQRNLFTSPTIPKHANDKENVLPQVIYVPPRQALKTTEPSLNLPSNIQQHLPAQPHITRHDGRIVRKMGSHIEEKLLTEDLSMLNLSNFNSTVPLEEISIHNCKDVFML